MEVEKVSNDVMMMWHGTHCGSLRTYFADKDIFETARYLKKKSARARARLDLTWWRVDYKQIEVSDLAIIDLDQ